MAMETLTRSNPLMSLTRLASSLNKDEQATGRMATHLRQGMERSSVTLTARPSLGITHAVSSYLYDHGASICSCTERVHDEGVYVALFVFDAPPDAMKEIRVDELQRRSQQCQPYTDWDAPRYQLTVVAPDAPGIVRCMTDMLLKRKVSILANDVRTFMASLGDMPSVGTQVDAPAVVASMNLMIGLPSASTNRRSPSRALDDLINGLEYIEHRYGWYVRLEQKKSRKSSNSKTDRLASSGSRTQSAVKLDFGSFGK